MFQKYKYLNRKGRKEITQRTQCFEYQRYILRDLCEKIFASLR